MGDHYGGTDHSNCCAHWQSSKRRKKCAGDKKLVALSREVLDLVKSKNLTTGTDVRISILRLDCNKNHRKVLEGEGLKVRFQERVAKSIWCTQRFYCLKDHIQRMRKDLIQQWKVSFISLEPLITQRSNACMRRVSPFDNKWEENL